MEYNKPEVILKTKNNEIYLTLEYDTENKWGYSNWHWKFEYGYEYVKEGCEAMLQFVQKYSFDRWLNDNRLVVGGWDEVNEWIATNWVPRLLDAGTKYYGVINSPELFSSLSSEFMEENVNLGGLIMRNFGSVEDAVNWLKEQ